MKTWEKPEIFNLGIEQTKMDTFGWGNQMICTVCCKTSNPKHDTVEHYHKGWCRYFGTTQGLVDDDKSIVCKS